MNGFSAASEAVKGTSKKLGMGIGMVTLLSFAGEAMGQERNCEYRDVVDLSAQATAELIVSARAGGLDIEGVEGLRTVEVEATMCASDADRLEALSAELVSGDSGLELNTRYPESRWSSGRNYARIDLQVRIPMGTDLNVVDGSGHLSIHGAGEVTVEDGSGGLEIRDVESIWVKDGSGEIHIEGVSGDLEVEDGSGELVIESVSGSVRVDDGSGSIRVSRVGGDVWMDEIGSGSVRVVDVEGGFTVEDGKRSRIDYRDVRGEIDLPADRRRGRRGG